MAVLKRHSDAVVIWAIVGLLITAVTGDQGQQICEATSPKYTNSACQCAVGDHFFDFSSLQRPMLSPYRATTLKSDGTALYTFYFNPCLGVVIDDTSDDNTCTESSSRSAICQHDTHDDKILHTFNSCGSIQNFDAVYMNSSVVFTFHDGFMSRSSYIQFQCDPSATGLPTLEYLGEKVKKVYYFRMKTSLACIKGQAPTHNPNSVQVSVSVSLGTILCIILLVSVIIYVGGGISFNKFARHRDGTALLPNTEFWGGLPSLIRDGFVFLVSKIRGSRSAGYENL